ncbi:MAG: YfhO family protein [Elusimicrobia bacterium]|nr:YfhO family protein [Elusimicrobiota bacterium]
MIARRDLAALALVAALPLVLLAPTLLGGQAYFSNDLTHATHPWRVFAAEQLQRGRLPLWNPYAYFGQPLLANFQNGVLHPVSALFNLFPFARALSPFLLATYWLAGLFAYLWLRRRGACPGAAAAGALLASGGGTMISHLQFPNFVAALAWGPALFLFWGRPGPAALASALGLLAGYPPVWAGMTAAWILLGFAFDRDARAAATGVLAAGLGALLGAAALLPGLELSRASGRGRGAPVEERTQLALDRADLLSVAHPELTRIAERGRRAATPELARVAWTYEGRVTTFTFVSRMAEDHVGDPSGIRYSPHVGGYLGVSGAAAAVAGLGALALRAPAAAAVCGGYAAFTLLVTLGSGTKASAWIWEHAPYFRVLRGPSRMTFLLLAVAPFLAALAVARARRAGKAVAAALLSVVFLELAWSGAGFYPRLPADYYQESGSLVRYLRAELRGLRYYLFPEIEIWPYVGKASADPLFDKFREDMYRSYKQKLFGVSNVPFHLEAAAGGHYEPLVAAESEAVIKTIKEAETSRALPALLAWIGCRFALTRKELPPQFVAASPEAILPGRLVDRGKALWQVYETPTAPGRARWLPADRAGMLEGRLQDAGQPPADVWAFERPREDHFRAEGSAPAEGTLFLAEAFYPGWRAFVNGKPAETSRALEAFTQVRVPAGPVRVDVRYRPSTFTRGVALMLAALAVLAVWAARLRGRVDFNSMASG